MLDKSIKTTNHMKGNTMSKKKKDSDVSIPNGHIFVPEGIGIIVFQDKDEDNDEAYFTAGLVIYLDDSHEKTITLMTDISDENLDSVVRITAHLITEIFDGIYTSVPVFDEEMNVIKEVQITENFLNGDEEITTTPKHSSVVFH
jgi:hypothetical protein